MHEVSTVYSVHYTVVHDEENPALKMLKYQDEYTSEIYETVFKMFSMMNVILQYKNDCLN